jgi:aminobenzoyl-glutamate utilization protein B
MPEGFKGAQVAAKALTLAAIELLENAELRTAARAEFDLRRGRDFRYDALLGERPPPLYYRS